MRTSSKSLESYFLRRGRGGLWPAPQLWGGHISVLVSVFSSALTMTISSGSIKPTWNATKLNQSLFCLILIRAGILSNVTAALWMEYGPSSGSAWQTSEIPMSWWSMPGISQTLSMPRLSLPLSSPSQLLQRPEPGSSGYCFTCANDNAVM